MSIQKVVNSQKAFTWAIITIGLLAAAVLAQIIPSEILNDLSAFLPGLLMILACVTAVIGIIYSFLSFREPNTFKKISAAIINFGIIVLFAVVLVANAIDIYKAIN